MVTYGYFRRDEIRKGWLCFQEDFRMSVTMEDVRNAVADALRDVGHGNELFVRDVREGRQDDGPFMVGALAAARLYEGNGA
jgi:hypothetical protein